MSTDLAIINSAAIKLGQEKIASYPDSTTVRGVILSEQYPKTLKDLLRKHPWNFADARTKVSITEYEVNSSNISIVDNSFSQAKHGYLTGLEVYVSTSDTLPSALTASTSYYVIKTSVDKFKLATSLANAIAGTAIALVSVGVGVQTISPQNITPEFGFTNQVILPTDWVAMQEVTSDSNGISNVDYKVEGGKILTDSNTFYIRYTKLVTDASLFPDDFSELLSIALAADTAYDILNSSEKQLMLMQQLDKELAQVRFQDGRDGVHKKMQVNFYTRMRY